VLVFRQMAAGLAHMHRRKVLHGNLEPGHAILGRNGVVRLIGYGLAEVPRGERPGVSKVFAAPEVVKEDRVVEQSDVYSLGAVMFALLTGQSPGSAKKAEAEGERRAAPAAINPKIPAALSNLIVSCMKVHPTKRPESVYDVLKELEGLAEATKLDDEALRGLAVAEG
jgi:serine/threonine protein kinase